MLDTALLPDNTMVFRSCFLPRSREYIMIKIRLIKKINTLDMYLLFFFCFYSTDYFEISNIIKNTRLCIIQKKEDINNNINNNF